MARVRGQGIVRAKSADLEEEGTRLQKKQTSVFMLGRKLPRLPFAKKEGSFLAHLGPFVKLGLAFLRDDAVRNEDVQVVQARVVLQYNSIFSQVQFQGPHHVLERKKTRGI